MYAKRVAQFELLVAIKTFGLNQMRMGESITSGNLAYQNVMVSEGIINSGRFGSPEGWYFGMRFDNSGSIYFEN